ncbi:MAG: TSUP family transporter [Anaerolineales bacterium]
MNLTLLIIGILSGMLGLGVAFAAVPLLSLFLPDLVNQVQLLTLVLNGLTALFSTFGFARSGFIDWKEAILLAVVASLYLPNQRLKQLFGVMILLLTAYKLYTLLFSYFPLWREQHANLHLSL